jgi:hypothetical protein
MSDLANNWEDVDAAFWELFLDSKIPSWYDMEISEADIRENHDELVEQLCSEVLIKRVKK